jgi:transposase
MTSSIEHPVAACNDGPILMSFPRAGRICAAQILAELGSVRERFDSDEAASGIAPRGILGSRVWRSLSAGGVSPLRCGMNTS